MPVNPPRPALRTTESIFGRVRTSFRARSRTERRDTRSSRSGWKETRVRAWRGWRARWCFSRVTVDTLFVSSRVVTTRRKDCEAGRVAINSSMRRQQMAKPSPLKVGINGWGNGGLHSIWILISPVGTSHQFIGAVALMEQRVVYTHESLLYYQGIIRIGILTTPHSPAG